MLQDIPNPYAVPLQSDSQTFGESSPLRSNSLEKCVICNGTPAYTDGPNVFPTCGRACSSKLLSACGVLDTNEPPTSDPPNMSSAPNVFDKDCESPRRTSELTQTCPDRSMEMCVICKGAPVYRDGTNIYSTCGMACTSILRAACDLHNANKPRTSDPPNTMSSAPNIFDKDGESPRRTPEPTGTLADRPREMCVICNGAPAHRDGSKIYPTCGRACSSKLLSANGLPDTNEPPTSDPPNMSSALNTFDKDRESPRTSEPTRTPDRSIGMCVICKGAPVYRDGPNIYLTCGMACASKLRATSVLPNINEPRTSDLPNMSSAPNIFDKDRGSPRQTSEPTRTYTDRSIEMCVICNGTPAFRDGSNFCPTCGRACASKLPSACGVRTPEPTPTYADRSIEMCMFCNNAPVYRDGPNVYSTCGMACASNLLAACSLLNTNKPSTSSSDPPDSAFGSSAPPRNNMTPRSLPNQIGMCDVCHVRPRSQRGGKIHPTCGLSCAAKLLGSVLMCDYCKRKPKAVIDGKSYPHCGKACRDKAKLAETGCILCRKSVKARKSDFCSKSCKSLAYTSAPFLIEIPRGHVSFEKVAEIFTSEWQTSEAHCPTIKKIYMVVMKKGFERLEKYSTKLGSRNFLFQRKKCTPSLRWLVFSSECNFGDPENLEPCCSNKCLLCSIVRSSFNRSDFPGGITTSGLNRTVDLSRADSSSKIAALMHVVVGREAEMSPRDVHVVSPLPPPNTDSVHIIGVRSDGSRLDLGDIIVYDGDAVWPIYLISYE